MPALPPPPPDDLVDACRDLSILENGVVAARQSLDEVAALISALAPGVRLPPTLSARLSEATARLIDVERERDLALLRVDSRATIDQTVPVRVYTDRDHRHEGNDPT